MVKVALLVSAMCHVFIMKEYSGDLSVYTFCLFTVVLH
ncbi:hypothetical protein VEx25_A1434 [Vibrio antiquarius]|uniref:Uncharacterized protein n=2 Tax=Vibrio antiquarius (strain Ex25) TaxID=150340 RepID=A0ACA6QSV1_VIBAE|nr:hypothetical protein VEA_001006 [Vibrio antiquarius]EDN58869.1 hypothetical protein VEx25_A1434 [Vibrio antiquarius]